jgi:hypothetical protein
MKRKRLSQLRTFMKGWNGFTLPSRAASGRPQTVVLTIKIDPQRVGGASAKRPVLSDA